MAMNDYRDTEKMHGFQFAGPRGARYRGEFAFFCAFVSEASLERAWESRRMLMLLPASQVQA